MDQCMLETAALKIKQLRWQCRRGMLEMDLFLYTYLMHAYAVATPEEQALFEALLHENDQQLFLWFTAQETVAPRYTDLVEKIRNVYAHANV